MKRLLCALLLAALLMTLAVGCETKSSNSAAISGHEDTDRDALLRRQSALIETFGRTQENDRIVGCQQEDDFFRFVIVYYVNGVRGEEVTHFVIFTPSLYEKYKAQYGGSDEVVCDDETQHISMPSALVNGENYAEDLEIVKQDYILR